jgi:hypothetical protein
MADSNLGELITDLSSAAIENSELLSNQPILLESIVDDGRDRNWKGLYRRIFQLQKLNLYHLKSPNISEMHYELRPPS